MLVAGKWCLGRQCGWYAIVLKEMRMRARWRLFKIATVVWLPTTLCRQGTAPPSGFTPTYVGSAACKTCHPAMYERWSKTRMANVVTDPKTHPEVILPDLAKADPLLTFKREDIALVYGTNWKQRYFQKVGEDY